jgi:glycosyltransferase involved in cell wall biosynthesis
MKTLSILTPILATEGVIELLPETIASVKSQILPPGWNFEWVVVEDGTTQHLQNFPWPNFVHYRAANKHVYESCARTLALSMAKGQYILSLDADDTLPLGALFKICTAYDENPEAMWVAGQEATPNHPTPWINIKNPQDRLPIGECKPGLMYPFWKRTEQFPVTFQSSYRSEVLWEFGGYPAMPYTGDVNLLLAVSSIYKGVILKDIVLNYRRWDGQMTAKKEHFSNKDLSAEHVAKWIRAITERRRRNKECF